MCISKSHGSSQICSTEIESEEGATEARSKTEGAGTSREIAHPVSEPSGVPVTKEGIMAMLSP